MRKKRLIAAVLVGTMVFSSVAYADVQEQGDATETQSVEQQLEEEQLEEQQLIAEYTCECSCERGSSRGRRTAAGKSVHGSSSGECSCTEPGTGTGKSDVRDDSFNNGCIS